MDEIWRERNTAQHTPKERKEINSSVQEAFEKKTELGLDQGPHTKAEDITNLPYRMKKNWLENAEKRIEAKEEENKRKLAAVKAITTGSNWPWNHTANAKAKLIKKKRTEPPVMTTPWAPLAEATEQPRQSMRKTRRAKTPSDKGNGTSNGKPTVHSPWDLSPMAAPAGSIASAGSAPPVAIWATGAAAAAATARPGATTAQIHLAPSTDLPRRERDGAPRPHTSRASTPHTPKTPRTPSVSDESEPKTPGQDNDPDNIDDVV
jgi:hypothetical protein